MFLFLKQVIFFSAYIMVLQEKYSKPGRTAMSDDSPRFLMINFVSEEINLKILKHGNYFSGKITNKLSTIPGYFFPVQF